MYYWLNFLIGGVLYVFCMGLFWSFMLEPRWKKYSRWQLCTIFMLVSLPPGIVRSFCDEISMLFRVMGYLQVAIIFLFLFGCFTSVWWKKILALLLYMITAHLAEGIILPAFELAGIYYNSDFASLEIFLLQTATCMVTLAFSAIQVAVWNFVEKKRKIPSGTWVFLLFPVSQLLMVWNVAKSFWLDESLAIPVIGGCLIGFLADILLFYVLMNYGEKEKLKKQVQELNYIRALEEQHYQELQSRQEQIARIRHDFKNHLITALHLIETDNREQAGALLEQLRDDVIKTEMKMYSENSVVNAVLSEKAMVCENAGIVLDSQVTLPNQLPIRPVHLCSLFSNLLDNAIHAAEKCSKEERVIIVKAALYGDYLNVKVENTVADFRKGEKPERKGYGQEIICDITKQYHGECYTEEKQNRYIAVVTLEL